jgi:hypothetical protein
VPQAWGPASGHAARAEADRGWSGCHGEYEADRAARRASRAGMEWSDLSGRGAGKGYRMDGRAWPRSRRSQSTSQARLGPARASSGCRIAQGAAHEEDPLRDLYPQEFRGRSGAGVQLAPCPAGGLRRLHRQPEARGLGDADRPIRRWRPVRRQSGTPGATAPPRRCPERPGRPDRGLQDRPAHPVARGLREDRRRAGCGWAPPSCR